MFDVFKTEAGALTYNAAYAATLTLWPVPVEETNLETRFGQVHALIAGPEDGYPMVLLHATNASSTMWFPNVAALTQTHRIYALDLPGHTGKSTPSRPIEKASDCALWIEDAMDALDIEQADLLGLSVGGWMALNLALHCPGCVRRVAALSPMGALGPVSLMLLLRMMPMVLGPTRQRLAGYIRWVSAPGTVMEPELLEQFIIGMQQFNFRNPAFFMPRPFTDAELAAITQPALVMVGEHEVMYNGPKALARASRLPRVTTEMIAGAGHFLSAERPDLVNRRLLAFFNSDGAA